MTPDTIERLLEVEGDAAHLDGTAIMAGCHLIAKERTRRGPAKWGYWKLYAPPKSFATNNEAALVKKIGMGMTLIPCHVTIGDKGHWVIAVTNKVGDAWQILSYDPLPNEEAGTNFRHLVKGALELQASITDYKVDSRRGTMPGPQ